MTLTITPQPVPLTQTEHGDIRVTGTRIGLEHIVEDYNRGASAELRDNHALLDKNPRLNFL